MSRRFRSFLTLLGCCLLALGLPALTVHAQARSAASQFNATSVSDQINLQVLDAVVQELNNSFTRSCSKPAGGTPAGTTVLHGQTWTSTVCPAPLTNGTITYVCLSGFSALQSSTCR